MGAMQVSEARISRNHATHGCPHKPPASRRIIAAVSMKLSCCSKCCRTALKFSPIFRSSISYKEHLRLSHFKTETSRSLPMTGPIRNPQKPRHAGRHDDDRARGNPGGNGRTDRRPETFAALAGKAVG